MGTDTFFNQTNCDRCGIELTSRTMSWFTDETICRRCSNKERELKSQLPDGGKSLEGCGYLPILEVSNDTNKC